MEGRRMENQRKRSVIHLDPNLPNCNNKHSTHKTKSALSFVTYTRPYWETETAMIRHLRTSRWLLYRLCLFLRLWRQRREKASLIIKFDSSAARCWLAGCGNSILLDVIVILLWTVRGSRRSLGNSGETNKKKEQLEALQWSVSHLQITSYTRACLTATWSTHMHCLLTCI